MSIKEALGLQLLKGQCTEGVEIRSNVVRVFISSTFSDMKCERDALLEKAYPELQAFCHTLGLVFEVVDLRWGVGDAVAVDHTTTELCLEEIQSCKTVSVGPSLIVLLGNRYGYRPIPRIIPENEFELLLSKLGENKEGVKLLNQWFWKDYNAVPPSYVLQPISTHLPHYSNTRPEVSLQHDKDVITWQHTEAQILLLLRTAALHAEKEGAFTAAQKHKFFKSVTEWEMELGLLGSRKRDQSTVLFVRELPRLKKNDNQSKISQLIDVTADGLVDAQAQDLLSTLKSQIYATCSDFLNLHCVELSKGRIDPSCKEHSQYLQNLCEQFISQMKTKISRATTHTALANGTLESEWSWLSQEIIHHMMLSSAKCAIFSGREGLLGRLCLNMWESSNSSHGPLVVFGPSGIGKTALMCRLAQEMRGVLGPKAVVVLRLLGTSLLSSDINSVLKSVCFQICGALDFPLPDSLTTNSHEDLVRFFHAILMKVSQKMQSLLIILDGLDQLSERNHAHKLHWLPKEIPPNIHLVVSTADAGLMHLNSFEGIIQQENFFEVEQLSFEHVKEIVKLYMGTVKRRLTPEQWNVFLGHFQQSGHPLLLHLVLKTAAQWASYTSVSELHLGSTVQEAVLMHLENLEMKHGKELVGSVLGYIISSRDGLSEAELCDLLSLDDEVLGEVYQDRLPPNHTLVRLPPLLWFRLKRDLRRYLEEKQINGIKMLGLYHRQVTGVVGERYLFAERRVKYHRVLSQYFLDQWSQGRFKSLFLPSLKTKLNADRKVCPQPLWFAEGVANKRKLRELPYHLIHAGCWDELQEEVIGNIEWIWCKTVTYGMTSIVEDLSLCLKVQDFTEMQLIKDTFLLMQPTVDCIDGKMDPALLYTELFARLYNLAEMYPSLIGRLCSQCQKWFNSCPSPVLVPACGFFQSPGGALKTTLTGFHKGITGMDVCVEKKLLAVGSEDGNVIVWNLKDLEAIHTLTGHTAGVQHVKIVNKGTRCLSLACDGTLRLWSLISGRQLYCIQTEVFLSSNQVPPIHMTEEKTIFLSTDGLQVKAWNLETGDPIFQVAGGGGQLTILGVFDEALAVLSDRGPLTFYDLPTGTEKGQICVTSHQDLMPTCAVTLKTQCKLIVGSSNGSVSLISKDRIETVAKLSSPVSFLLASDDEDLLAAASEKQVAMYRVQANAVNRFLTHAFQHDDTVLTAATPSHCRVLVTGSEDHLIRIWCLSTGDLLDSFIGTGAPVTALAVAEDTVISASNSSSSLKLWKLTYNRKHRTNNFFPASSPLVTVTRDGKRVYFLKHGNRAEVVAWNCQTGAASETMAVSAEVSCMELAQKKKMLFCGVKTGTILIYPLAHAPETLCIPPPETLPAVRCMVTNPAEDRMAVAYQDSVCVFEITERDSFPCIEGPCHKLPLSLLHSPISSIALLSDCRLLQGTEGGEIMLHDFKSTSATSMDRHQAKITCISLSNSESLVLIGSQDSVQRLWNLSPLELKYTMEYKGFFFEGVLCSAFSENDQYIYTGSQDRTIKVWDVVSGNLLVAQYVYAPVTKILSYKDGFVAVSQLGQAIKERFSCPKKVSLWHNPVRNIRAKYRVISRARGCLQSSNAATTALEPHQHNATKTKSARTCSLF
ncbi:NACHT domain- and WD repeat-containing protein 1 [Arapaima gigas]